jgi:transcriptional regulator with XRE-family HTH domain
MRANGLKVTGIARRAKINPSTVYRWLRADGTAAPDLGSLQKIAQAFGVENPIASEQGWSVPSATASGPGALREPEVAPLQNAAQWPAKEDDLNVFDRVLTTRALELDGYIPGDIVRCDMRLRAPRKDDIVVFNRPDNRGGEETLIRKYAPPFLIARTLDPALGAPILLDDSVTIMGIVTMSLRRRRD